MAGLPSPDPYTHHTEAPAFRRGLLSSKAQWRAWVTIALDLVFPPRCAGCGRVDALWCGRCAQELNAAPLDMRVREVAPLSGIACTALHEARAQDAVHALKYGNVPALAPLLAARLEARLAHVDWTYDTIAPVPLHQSRLRSRGYNQAQVLVEALAGLLMLPYITTALTRVRDTRSQVGLSGAERRANVQGAFRGDADALSGRTILLVDDVFTTGATFAACAQAALDAGAAAVYGLTVTAAR